MKRTETNRAVLPDAPVVKFEMAQAEFPGEGQKLGAAAPNLRGQRSRRS